MTENLDVKMYITYKTRVELYLIEERVKELLNSLQYKMF